MTPTKIDNMLVWGRDIEKSTIEQALQASRLPFVHSHVALMPDAHIGKGATIGSVIPTRGAIIPAAVGVDIGCGMIAAELPISASQLPDNLDDLMPLIERRIPAGVGQGHQVARGDGWLIRHPAQSILSQKERDQTLKQFGTLGSGNHFVEVCLDERDHVWIVLHSGSRGIGNRLARRHIDVAKGLMKQFFIELEDPDLAYLVQGTDQFEDYIADLLWAQEYAAGNRRAMLDEAVRSLGQVLDRPLLPLETQINCHHNYTQMENHGGQNVWLTRKGAIRAAVGAKGVIPGSMGTHSYIVTGLGNPGSYDSCSHGAGRRISRTRAKRELSPESLAVAMTGRTWNANHATDLVDEHPRAYKDIDRVMEDQADLVEVTHTLRQVFNYKG